MSMNVKTAGNGDGSANGAASRSVNATRDIPIEMLQALRAAVRDTPENPASWRNLARAMRSSGDRTAASVLYARSITASTNDTELLRLEQSAKAGDVSALEGALESRLKNAPDDIVAMRLLADHLVGSGRQERAEQHYRLAIDLCPSYLPARHGMSKLLFEQARLEEAAIESERMLATAPLDARARMLKAAIAASIGDNEDAASLYSGLLADQPEHPSLWLGLGHSHRILGRTDQAIKSYRKAAEHEVTGDESRWCLANLKTFRFSDTEVGDLLKRANEEEPNGQKAVYIHFALGKHFHDLGKPVEAFDHFERGNAAKRAMLNYDASVAEKRLDEWIGATAGPVEEVTGDEYRGSTPIFIVGLPRSGSTLLEQILGAHGSVEATAELPYLDSIAGRLSAARLSSSNRGEGLFGHDLPSLGREYLARARVHRKTAKPYFIDKLPGNFAHVGLIRRILPHAKIIDMRREGAATLWSIYKQLFWRGHSFAYEQTEIARWYLAYDQAMRRFDDLYPGAIIRVKYEALVRSPEAEVGAILEALGLPFDAACLRHHEHVGPIRTPSSDQVRRPIHMEALDEWHQYADQLKLALALL